MKNKQVKILSFVLLFYLLILVPGTHVQADNLTHASGVTKEMSQAGYWKEQSVLGVDKILATGSDVRTYNNKAYESSGTGIYGIAQKARSSKIFTAKYRLGNDFTKDLYINGTKINTDVYYNNLKTQYEDTAYPVNTTQNYKYGIVVKRCDMLSWPTSDVIGYSPSDADDENELSAMVVNEPFLIMQECTIDGKDYYWGMSDNCSGWVSADNIALCADAEEWLAAWEFDVDGKDFLVVTQDKITLEASYSNAYSSKVLLDLGCALPLVPASEWDEATKDLAERGTWNNYVVYIPTKAEDGSYVRRCALISEHYKVSIGYLPVTEANILDISFSCLGNRYGWGGMLEAVDCSFYVRNIYRCFGYTLPRNTSWQPNVEGYTTDVSSMSDAEKAEYLSTLPIGSLLYFPGHVFMYTGTVDGVNYAISATGSLSDSVGDVNVQSMYSIILNPLTVRRRNGNTWLTEMNRVVTFTGLRHTNHVLEVDPAVKATCLQTGKTEGSHCSLCGKVVTAQIDIPKTDHSWDAGTIVVSHKLQGEKVLQYTCQVCKQQKIEVNNTPICVCRSIKITGISHQIAAGKSISLNAILTPANASFKTLKWKSSNKKVATVDQNGKVCIKKNTGGKMVAITATTTDGSNITSAFLIKVKKGAVKKITLSGAKTVNAKKSIQLKAKVVSSKGANRTLRWKCSNTKYATVSSKGLVKAKVAGKGKVVMITVISTDGTNKRASKKIIIK